jgi:exonuclease VII large subunit
MTPTEKAEAALNHRLEQLQVKLRASTSETLRRFLVQSIMASIALGEAMTDYVRMIGQYAQGRYSEIKDTNATLTAQHAELLKSGGEMLERLKANPGDQAIRKEIERAQQAMESIQKTLRRGADSLQRDLAPSMSMVDKIAASVRRLAEADQPDALKRAIGMIVGHVRELYVSHPGLPAKNIINAEAWENAARREIDNATDFYEAYALTGYQALRAIAVMTMAVSPTPPATAEEGAHAANESVATRLKEITLRFGSN